MSEAPLLAIIDDDDAVRAALCELLGVLGYSVRIYASAEQFLAGRGNENFACIITDLRLPGLDGLELHAKLKALGEQTPLILVTSHISPQAVERAKRAGVHAVLLKPLATSTLVAKLTAILKERKDSGRHPGDSSP